VVTDRQLVLGSNLTLVTCEAVPSTFTSTTEVEITSAESVQENAALKSFRSSVRRACKEKLEQCGIPAGEKRFKVDVPLGGSWGSLLTQPIRVSGISNKVHARILRSMPFFSTSSPELAFVTLQIGMSPVKQVLQENHVKTAASSSSASEIPAWFAAYKQEADQKFLDQKKLNEKQGEEIEKIKQQSEEIKQQIKRLSKIVQAYEDTEIRKLKECGRSKILAALKMQHMPHQWNTFVGNLSSKQESLLRANKISQQAVLATSYDRYQKQGNVIQWLKLLPM